MGKKLVKAPSKKPKNKPLTPQEAKAQAEARGEKWTTEQGNPRIYIVVLVILILAILLAWLRNVTQGYVDSFALNGSDGADAISGVDALAYTSDEEELLKDPELSWDDTKNSVLWDKVTTTSADGLELAAKLYNADAKKTVIVFGQFGEISDSDFLYGSYFKEQGYNILMTDIRGTGDSAASNCTYGLTEAQDVEAWASYVTENLGGEVLLYGRGMGANAILYYLTSGNFADVAVSGVICESPYSDVETELKYVLKEGYGLSGVFFNLMKWYAGQKGADTDLTPAFTDACTNFQANGSANALPKVLFLVADNDDYIPAEYSMESYNAYPGEKDLITAEVRHGLIYASEQSAIEKAIAQF